MVRSSPLLLILWWVYSLFPAASVLRARRAYAELWLRCLDGHLPRLRRGRDRAQSGSRLVALAEPPTANLVTREENQQTLAAPQYDNQEFQQTHAAETALRQAWDSGVTPLLPSVERTTDHHRRVNAHPLAAGVAEAGLHQAQESPVPAGTLPPGNQLQVQQPLLLRQTTQITQPVHRAAGARSTGPPVYYIIEKQPPRARRAASAGKQVLTRKQKTSARNDDAKVRKVSAEQKRGTRLASSFGLKAPEQPEQPPPRQLPAHSAPPVALLPPAAAARLPNKWPACGGPCSADHHRHGALSIL